MSGRQTALTLDYTGWEALQQLVYHQQIQDIVESATQLLGHDQLRFD